MDNLTVIDAIEQELTSAIGPVEVKESREYPTIAENVSERVYIPLEPLVICDDTDQDLKRLGYRIRADWGIREVWIELTSGGNVYVEVRTQKSHVEGK